MTYDVLIIGSGPGGMTAALYAARANLKTLLLEMGAPGGQMNNTQHIENYPGFTKIPGFELGRNMHESALEHGVISDFGIVTSVVDNGATKIVTCEDGAVFEAKVVIIATGSVFRKLDVPGEAKYAGRGVSYCAVCDGAFFKDRDVVVVGGGDSAIEEAQFLTQFASKVTVVHRRDELRAQKILQDRAFANPKIEFVWDSVVEEVEGSALVEGVVLKNVKTGAVSKLAASGVFIYVGLLPNSGCFENLGILDDEGWIPTDGDMHTDVKGIFAVGDVRRKHFRQIATAVGDGAKAGQGSYNYLIDNDLI
ncbi:MAG: thioredoxin-disulfide reductase [Lactobacillales bacterium]|jgi:thioredoxin reductase (NADPH)|nr:thioredoxin-disulfide reductase [Lactobacillales bacterium]